MQRHRLTKIPKGKKEHRVLLSVGLVGASMLYAFSQYSGVSQAASGGQLVSNPSAPSSTVVSAKTGAYRNGTYAGMAVSAYYGTVQVEAVVQHGQLAAVNFLQYPGDRSTSMAINSRATRALASEAIAAQSAHVSAVSGATFTTDAFAQSLSSALAQAKA